MIIPPLAANFTAIYEWRSAYVIMAVMIWVAASPAVILLSKKPPRSANVKSWQRSGQSLADSEIKKPPRPQGLSAREAVKTNSFWALMLTGFTTATGFYFLQVHIIAYGTDMKIASTSAAFILTFLNVGSMAAQLLGWTVTSRIGSRRSVIIFIAFMALAMFLLMGVKNLWMLFALAAVFGLGFGGCTTVRMSMIAEFFGMGSLGVIVGLVTTSWAIGGIIGPILAGYIFDISHSYHIAFLTGGLLLTIGVFSGFFLKAPHEKQAQLDLSV
jgi:MFS family permease